jgi:hypothetical protein
MYRARNHKQSLMLALSATAILSVGCSDNGPLAPAADLTADQAQVEVVGGGDRLPVPTEERGSASMGDVRAVTEASLANVQLLPGMSIGPVARLTTGWHAVDGKTLPIPFDSAVLLVVAAESGVRVEWGGGAREVARDALYSEAIYRVLGKGTHHITATILRDDAIESYACDLKGVNVAPWDVTLRAALVMPEAESFASGDDAGTPVTDRSNFFRTFPGRPLSVRVDANPTVFSSLMEWRIDGKVAFLGSELSLDFADLGLHTVSIGPPGRARNLTIQIYSLDEQEDLDGGDRRPHELNP